MENRAIPKLFENNRDCVAARLSLFLYIITEKGRKQMGEKDLTEKLLEDYEDIFADIVNVLLFDGEQRVKPESLASSNVHSMYKADGKIHEQERDVLKTWKELNVEIALFGLENQTKVEKLMPFRIFGYEGASYRGQLLNKKESVYPVITLVLYFGKERWNQPKTLKELINVPKGLEEYVNDLKINVFEISWLSEEQISKFTSDFKVVANFFVKRRMDANYIPDDDTEIKHIDEVLKLLSVMTGDNRYEEILQNSEGGALNNMCEVAERLENKGRIEGRTEERLSIIKKMIESGLKIEQIKACGFSDEEIEAASIVQ